MEDNIIPDISVIMAVYNGEKFIKDTLNSIIAQTFKNFEFIIIDDGSIDNTHNIIKTFTDKRIKYLVNEKNKGTVESLNRGLLIAKGEFIARIDADDIAHTSRLEKQYHFLKSNPSISIIGCHINFINEQNDVIGKHIFPINDNEIKAMVPFQAPFGGPCVMFRNKEFNQQNLRYVQEFLYAEDYDLWQRALTKLNGANYDEILLDYRISSSQVSNKHYAQQQIADKKIKTNSLRILGLNVQTIDYLNIFLKDTFEPTQAENFNHILNALSELFSANKRLKIYDNNVLKKSVVVKLEKIITFYASKTFKLFKLYQKSELYKYNNLSVITKTKCFIKQLTKT